MSRVLLFCKLGYLNIMANFKNSGYHPGDSILHTTKTRNKMLLALACIFFIALGEGPALLIMFFLCHLGMVCSEMPILDAWRRLVELKILFLVIGIIPLFITPGVQLYILGGFPLPITREGFECGFFASSRLACMVWISMILVWATSPQSFMKIASDSQSKFFANNKILQEFILLGILSFQLLPWLFVEVEEKIRNHWQENKNQTKRSRIETVKSMVKLIVVWVVQILCDPEQQVRRSKEP